MKWKFLNFGYRLHRLYQKVRKPVTLGSRALVLRNEEVLLVRLTYYKGWFLPGGGVDRGETFHAAVQRELQEECKIQAQDCRLFGLYLNPKGGRIDHVAIYVVERFLGEPACGDPNEIAEVRFFHRDQLPSELWSGHRRRIEEFFGDREIEHVW